MTTLYIWIVTVSCIVLVDGKLVTVFGDETLRIECGPQSIVIERVWYGGSEEASSCVKPNAWQSVVKHCFNVSFCHVYLNLVNNPDPCPGEKKKLEVTFACVDGNHILDSCLANDTMLEVGKPLFIVSPNYPQYYDSDLECELNIASNSLHRSDLKVEVVFMQMQHKVTSTGCYDKLLVEKPGNPAKSYEFCGTSPGHSQNPARLIMEQAKFITLTDHLTNLHGFVVKVTSVAWLKACSRPNPCLNGARCIQSDSGSYHYCECEAGFYGSTCAKALPKCLPCRNDGICISTTRGSGCKCLYGYYGPICENYGPDNCVGHTLCQNNATCMDDNDDFRCVCLYGYSGKYCEEAVVGHSGSILHMTTMALTLMEVFFFNCT